MRLRARPLSVAVLGGGCLAAALLLWAPGGFNLRENVREVIECDLSLETRRLHRA